MALLEAPWQARAVRAHRLLAPLFLAAALASPGGASAEPHAHGDAENQGNLGDYVPGAAELDGRIIAPCCWNQTIDIHGSEVSSGLRREIRERLRAGETPANIEAALVERYGKKILAVPQGSRLGSTGVLLGGLFASAGLGAVFLLRRWQQRSASRAKAEGAPGSERRDALDERLDAELSRLD